MELDLSEFERRIAVRPLREEDYEAIVELQKKCFPSMGPWKLDQFQSMLSIFQEGQVCVELDGKIVASSSSLIIDRDLYSDFHDWRTIADGGYIRNHDPEGDVLYGIEIMVDPECRGMKLARRLYDARKEIARNHNLTGIVIGGRIPNFAKYQDQMSAQEFVQNVEDKTIYDPVLTTQLANGFELKELLPDYLPGDEDSGGWATHMEWTNVDYRPFKTKTTRAIRNVRLASAQYEMREVDTFEEFARQCRFFIDTASDYRCDFLVFPELITTQLMHLVPSRRPGQAARKLTQYTEQYLEFFSEAAVKYHVNIIGGSQFSIEDEWLYNVSYIFHRDGRIGRQKKIHITSAEWKWWGVTGGEKLEVFDTDCGRVAILISYDIQFPELARLAAHKGAQILFCPFNIDERHGYLRIRNCAKARCIENHVFVAISGCTGNQPLIDSADMHYSQSAIFTPADFNFAQDGIAADCTPNVETLVMQDLDMEELRRHRHRGTTQNWRDRRTDLYKIVFQEDDSETSI